MLKVISVNTQMLTNVSLENYHLVTVHLFTIPIRCLPRKLFSFNWGNAIYSVSVGMAIFYEKRTSERFDLRCLVLTEEERGWSRDISSTGIYFKVAINMKKNDTVQMTIKLNKESVVQCEGKVIRTDKQDDGYGVAVQFTRMLFGS